MANLAWFENYCAADRPAWGGKNASLGELLCAGMPVPPGFAITAAAYKSVLGTAGLVGPLYATIAGADPDDSTTLAKASRDARRMVTGAALPAELVDTVRAAYTELCARCGFADVPVAVRSSATCEDQPDASFAGEHDTYLWIRGTDDVLDHMRRCWASLFTERAICYRRRMGYAEELAAMSVGVQKMATPRAAGVAFTLNPHDGDRSQVAIDASWGFGEAVVSGEVTPDHFLVDKVFGEISRRTVSTKEIEYRLDALGRIVRASVGADRGRQPCLAEDEVKAVAALARRAERHYGCPQDVEWAIDARLPAGENVLLLQSRPETVWSRRPRPSVCGSGNYMTSIVNTLVSPLHTRPRER